MSSSEYVEKDFSSSSPSSIPVVDLNVILSASAPAEAKQEEMEKLRCALASWGFFQAVGHGISNALLDDVLKVTKEFFNLPLEEKRKYSVSFDSKNNDTTQGYGSKNDDTTQGYGNDQIIGEGQNFDRSDRLLLLVKPQEQRKLKFWPECPKQFREVLHKYSIKTTCLADTIVKVMAKLLGLEDDAFLDQFGEEAPIYARFNYYQRGLEPKPHSDGNGLTILLPDKDVEGLQVLKDGEWCKVPIIPHALVVNVADQLEIMSNGMYKSVVHRVVPAPDKERISLAMFYSPYFDNEIGPADGLIDETRPRVFHKMKVKDYMQIFIEKFLEENRAIDYVKV